MSICELFWLITYTNRWFASRDNEMATAEPAAPLRRLEFADRSAFDDSGPG